MIDDNSNNDDTGYQYHPNPFRDDDPPTLEERITDMSEEDFRLIYNKLMVRLGINRHSDPAFQIKAVLSVDRTDLLRILIQLEEGLRNAS